MKLVEDQLLLSYHSGVPLMLWGSHGIGKSSIVRSFAQKQNLPLVNLVLSQLEAVDLLGLPYVENNITHYAKPDWWPDKPSLVFLDELNRAQRYEINAVHQLACENRLHNAFLPPGSFVVAACNPPDVEYGLTSFGAAFISRFSHVKVPINHAKFNLWVKGNNFHGDISNYLSSSPSSIGSGKFDFDSVIGSKISPNPRAWEYVNKLMISAENLNMLNSEAKSKALWEMVNGLLGGAAGTTFKQYYYSNKSGDSPIKPEELFQETGSGTGDHRIPKSVKEKIKKWSNENIIPLLLLTLQINGQFLLDDYRKRSGKEYFDQDEAKRAEFIKMYANFFETLLICPEPVQRSWVMSLSDSVWTEIIQVLFKSTQQRYTKAFTSTQEG